jgi:hypothetical protein
VFRILESVPSETLVTVPDPDNALYSSDLQDANNNKKWVNVDTTPEQNGKKFMDVL